MKEDKQKIKVMDNDFYREKQLLKAYGRQKSALSATQSYNAFICRDRSGRDRCLFSSSRT